MVQIKIEHVLMVIGIVLIIALTPYAYETIDNMFLSSEENSIFIDYDVHHDVKTKLEVKGNEVVGYIMKYASDPTVTVSVDNGLVTTQYISEKYNYATQSIVDVDDYMINTEVNGNKPTRVTCTKK